MSSGKLRAVIRAWGRPPCTGALERFERTPDIPEEIAAQTASSSQSALNSRIAAPPLKIGIWTGERAVERDRVWVGEVGEMRSGSRGGEEGDLFHSKSIHNVITEAGRKNECCCRDLCVCQ